MPSEYVLTLGILAIVIGLPVLFTFVLKLNKQKHEQKTSKGVDLDQEETKTLNDLHRGLERMEKRIEALETIIMEKRR
jgi:phage shock protein B